MKSDDLIDRAMVKAISHADMAERMLGNEARQIESQMAQMWALIAIAARLMPTDSPTTDDNGSDERYSYGV